MYSRIRLEDVVSKTQGFEAQATDEIRKAFAGRLTVNFAEAAQILDIDEKLLRWHSNYGSIGYLEVGHGRERRRRRFTCEDLVDFLCGCRRRASTPATPRRRRSSMMDGADDAESFLEFTARVNREGWKTVVRAPGAAQTKTTGVGDSG